MYKITFDMISPICFIDRPIFDGIVYYCYMNKYYREIKFDQKELEQRFKEAPIKWSSDGYPLSSFMFFDSNKNIQSVGSWKKRWDNNNDDIACFKGNGRKRIDVASGQYKSYDMPLSLNNIKKVWFYFESCNYDEIGELITNQLGGIGKKTSQGYGFFKSFDIIETNDFDFDKDVLRPIPEHSKLFKDENTRYCGWKPPYWDINNVAKCTMPRIDICEF